MHQGKLIQQVFAYLGGMSGINGGKERLKEMLESGSPTLVARQLSEALDIPISRQNVNYWKKIVNKPQLTADKEHPLPVYKPRKKPKFNPRIHNIDYDGETLLFISDSHAPYHHRDLLDFYQGVADKYNPGLVVHGGDEADYHAMSMHDSDPGLASAGPEMAKAREFMATLGDIFPKMYVIESNHGSMVYRRAKKYGIFAECLRTYEEMMFPDQNTRPEWSWHPYLRVTWNGEDYLFKHQHSGDLTTGASHESANLFVGHFHSKFGIGYRASTGRQYYSVYAGSGVDEFSLAMAYGKETANKPVLGCCVVTNGVPHLVPMILDERGNWNQEVH